MADTDFSPEEQAYIQQDRASAAQSALAIGVHSNPDLEAEAQRLAATTGLPQSSVAAFPKQVQQRQNLLGIDYQALARDTPHTANFLSNVQNAKIAHDDIPNLSGIEKGLQPAGLSNALRQGWSSFKASLYSAGSDVGLLASPLLAGADKAFGTDATDWWFRNVVQPGYDYSEATTPKPTAPFSIKAAAAGGNLFGMLAQIASTGGAGEAAAGKSAMEVAGTAVAHATKAMAFPALSQAVDTGRQVFESTGDPWAALEAATAAWGTNTAIGLIPLSAPGGLATRLAGGFVSGATVGEISRNVMNLAMPQLQPFDLDQFLLSGLAGAALGGVMGPRAMETGAVRDTYVKAAQADAAAGLDSRIADLAKAAADSKLRGRSAESFKEAVGRMAENSDLEAVYVDGDKLAQAFHQSGMSMDALPQVAAQVAEAVQTRGTVRIPIEDYLTRIVGSPVDDAIRPELRASPDGMSVSEGQGFYDNQVEAIRAQAIRVLAEKSTDDAFQADKQTVQDSIRDQLNAIKRFRPEVNEVYARIAAEHYAVAAGQEGRMPSEMLEQYPLHVAAENPAAGGFNQAGMEMPKKFTRASLERLAAADMGSPDKQDVGRWMDEQIRKQETEGKKIAEGCA